MKKLLFIITLFFIVSGCKEKKKENKEEQTMVVDNKELYNIYYEDKTSWDSGIIDSDLDSIRRMRVNQLLDSNKIKTANDFERAAIVFEHGKDSTNLKKALNLIKIAVEMDSTINKKTYATITDQYLLSIGKPQIYGTIFTTMDNYLIKHAEIDTTQVTDKERISYGVETLAEQKASIKKANDIRAEVVKRANEK
ncbi:hypothetical protein HN014_15120 [Aquimarina sp. TRL1]|uniref:DUF6624 domain-containing protein n=1 Tax=Aquimarina sp. (strain TRL1) TaxID=2736252 RepID=UPI00158CE6B9|nr:DUF6624 domain-containing protein [Aquimarina sp. TRL1]QKX06184.1 hypothetical protein HN014_15120 [Aquimarina sp. TRL1]